MFHISFISIYNSRKKKTKKKKKVSKIKTFLIESQPSYILSMFLKFWLIAAYTFLKEGSHKKNSVIILVPEYSHSEEHEHSQSVHVLRGLSSGISICMFRLHRVLHRTNEKKLSHFQKH